MIMSEMVKPYDRSPTAAAAARAATRAAYRDRTAAEIEETERRQEASG